MKTKKRKTWFVWLIGILVFLSIPLAFYAKETWSSFRVKVGQNKHLINELVRKNYEKEAIDDHIIADSRNQVHNIFDKTGKDKGKFLALGSADTIPSFADALGDGYELSYNLPVQFEKGFVTFIFRVRNLEEGKQQVIWAEVADGILPKDDVKRRIQNRMP